MSTEAATPVFFAPNRVWRPHVGGLLLDRFVGNREERDDHFPEDWLASVVHAVNGENSQGPWEGLARVLDENGQPGPFLVELIKEAPERLLGAAHVECYGQSMGVLCKYLDASVRLPIQCHPDVSLAEELYHSNYGKTESWYILDTREIQGVRPYLLLGFKPGVTREAFAETVKEQNLPAMEDMLHKIHCAPGEMYFVPGRFPHAVGPGVLMVETQEPSDWCVSTERYCADHRLSDRDQWGRLSPAQGLDVFDYRGRTEDEILREIFVRPEVRSQSEQGSEEILIGPRQTQAFGVHRVTVRQEMKVRLPRAFGIIVVTAGEGRMTWPGGERSLRRSDYFLQPAAIEEITYHPVTPLTLLLCLPPEP